MFLKGLFVFAALVAVSTQAAVEVSVYYESLCPDSIRFINRQLYPTWQTLGSEYMTVDFVPYGKATHTQAADGTWSYTCQHGPDECAGNRVQACALSSFNGDQTKSNEYVHCAMSASYPPNAGPTCAASVGTSDYTAIQACIDGALGDTLIVAHGERTHAFTPKITFVPTIAFDGKYTVADQNGALTDLLSVVCGKITGTKPSACADLTEYYDDEYDENEVEDDVKQVKEEEVKEAVVEHASSSASKQDLADKLVIVFILLVLREMLEVLEDNIA